MGVALECPRCKRIWAECEREDGDPPSAFRVVLICNNCDDGEPIPLLGDLIRSERAGFGLSLSALGKKCGLSKAHLWELESGRSFNPSVEALSSIAAALRIAPTRLFEAAMASRRALAPEDVGAPTAQSVGEARQGEVALQATEPLPIPTVTTTEIGREG